MAPEEIRQFKPRIVGDQYVTPIEQPPLHRDDRVMLIVGGLAMIAAAGILVWMWGAS